MIAISYLSFGSVVSPPLPPSVAVAEVTVQDTDRMRPVTGGRLQKTMLSMLLNNVTRVTEYCSDVFCQQLGTN